MVIKFWRRGHFCAPHCPVSKLISPAPALSAYQCYIACRPGPTPRTHLNHILCASAATLATPAHAMNPDLRDHLARRATPRCSLRYYRTSPAPNDTHHEPFKKSVSSAPSIPAPPHPRSPAQRRPNNLYIDLLLCYIITLCARQSPSYI